MTAQLRHARFERSTGAGGREEEQHRQHFVAQIWMRFAQSAFALQVPGYFQNSFDFFFREVQVADKIATSKISLHNNSLLIFYLFFSSNGVRVTPNALLGVYQHHI